MTIERINTNLPTSEKIRLLNEMIMELKGLVAKGQFDKNELDQIITDLNAESVVVLDRKFIRSVSLGHLLADYTDWSHVKAETGYSIWKMAPTNYAHNALNELYLDDVLLTHKGAATAESASSFDVVKLYDTDVSAGPGYVDHTTEAGTEVGTEFGLMAATGDFLYIGDAATFGGVKFEFKTRGSNYTNLVEYWNGSAWTAMSGSGDNLVDNTSDFESDGLLTYDIPGDWATTAVDGDTKYWIRISTSTVPVTVAEAYYIIPGNTVPGLLALSSSQIIDSEWAWCSFGGSVYVTIRNSGNTSFEGNYYITSASTAVNLQNFFIHNHHFTANHEDTSYVA